MPANFQGNGYEIALGGPEPKLPHNCRVILKRSDSRGYGIASKNLYERLCSGVMLDQQRKKYWIDKKTGYNHFMLFPKDFVISWSDDKRYWKWVPPPQEGSNEPIEMAELLNVCWLQLQGRLDTSYLSPGVVYVVAFVVMFRDGASGWNLPVTLTLTLPDGKKQEHKEDMSSKPKEQWMEIVAGEFRACQGMDGHMDFIFMETDGHWKSGLVFKNVIIRPKSCGSNNDDKPAGDNHFTVISKDLSITRGDDQRYWRWYCLNETSNDSSDVLVDVAELLNVCSLEVKGKFNTSKLMPEIVYEVAFVVMLKDLAYGWEDWVNLQLVLPDGKMQDHKECLQHKPKGKWMMLKVGEFKKCPGNADEEIQFSLFEIEGGKWKKGLVIKNVVIRPKNQVNAGK